LFIRLNDSLHLKSVAKKPSHDTDRPHHESCVESLAGQQNQRGRNANPSDGYPKKFHVRIYLIVTGI